MNDDNKNAYYLSMMTFEPKWTDSFPGQPDYDRFLFLSYISVIDILNVRIEISIYNKNYVFLISV